MNCRNGSITRKTILNRKNQEKSTVQIPETRIPTVRIGGEYGSDSRNFKVNRKNQEKDTVQILEILILTV